MSEVKTKNHSGVYARLGRLVSAVLIPLLSRFRTASSRERVRAAVIVGNEILLVKNWFGPQQWEMPGGGRKRTETYSQAILRELKEELSITVGEEELKQTGTYVSQKSLLQLRCFKASLKEKPFIQRDRKELLAAKWFNLSDPIPDCDEVTLTLILSFGKHRVD